MNCRKSDQAFQAELKFEYYISEPVVANDAKGVAPFVLCYTEMLRLPS